MTVWDFSDYTDITRTTCFAVNWTLAANPAELDLGISAPNDDWHAAIHVAPAGFSGGESFIAYGRLYTNTSQPQAISLYVLGANGELLKVGYREYPQNDYDWVWPDSTTGTRCTSLKTSTSVIATTSKHATWIWFKIVYSHGASQVTYYYNDDNVTSKPAPNEWTFLGIDTVTIDRVTELGFHGQELHTTAVVINADDLEIVGSLPPTDISSVNVGAINFYAQIGAGGGASIMIEDDNYTDLATIKALNRTTVVISDTTYGKEHFRGEVVRVKPTRQGAILELDQLSRKLNNTLANHNPLIASHVVERVKDNKIYLKEDQFGIVNSTDYMISFEKGDTKGYICHPVAVNHRDKFGNPFGENFETGDDDNLYFDDGGGSDANNSWGIADLHGDFPRFTMRCEFEIYLKENTTVKSANLEFVYRLAYNDETRGAEDSQGYTVAPASIVRDFQAGSWLTMTQYTAEETEPTEATIAELDNLKVTRQITETVDLVSEFTWGDIFDAVGAVNSSEMQQYRLWVGIDVGQKTSAAEDLGAIIDRVELKIVTEEQQYYGEGLGLTDVQTAILITLQQPAWNSVVLPDEDGINKGDVLRYSKNLNDMISDIETDSGISQTFDWSVSTGDEFTETNDLTNMKLFELFQTWMDQTNALFWQYQTTIYFRDSFSSSGVEIDETDLVNYEDDDWDYYIDSRNQKTTLKAIGYQNQEGSSSPSVEYAFSSGSETQVYRNGELLSKKQIDDFATQAANRHGNATVYFTFKLNYSNPPKNYFNIELGKTIAIVISGLCDYKSGGADGTELLIIGLQMNKEVNGPEIMKVYTQLRN